MFSNAHRAVLGPRPTFTLINEATAQQGLVTHSQSPTSVRPLSFVTGVVLGLADVNPQFPDTSQSLVEACFREIGKFSCLEISGAVPS